MDKAMAQARQIAAQEATAEGVKEIMARLDVIEAKLEKLLKAAKPGKGKETGDAPEPETKKAGA